MVFRLVPGGFSRFWRLLRYSFGKGCRLLVAIVVIAAAIAQPAALAVVPQYRVVVSGTKGAAVPGAVVTLRAFEGAGKAPPVARPRLQVPITPVVIQQLDREFVPRVTVVPVGARISLPNNDAVPHSVYSFSAAKQFEFEVYVGSSPQVLTLDKAGIITLGCNIHDWMVGYVVVVDTPFAQSTDARGAVSFANVPEGDYELRVWHPQQKAGDHTSQVSVVEPGQPKTVTIDVSPPRARYKPPLTLKRY